MANGFVQIAWIREIPGWKAAGDHWAQLPCSSWATWSRLCSTAFSQVGFEHLQGWRPLILSAQPFSVFDHPLSEKSVSLCSDGSSRSSLCPLPATWHATEKNLPQLHFLLPGVFYALRFPMSLLSSSSLSLSCQMLQTISDLCSPAPHSLQQVLLLLLLQSPELDRVFQTQPHQFWTESREHPSQPAGDVWYAVSALCPTLSRPSCFWKCFPEELSRVFLKWSLLTTVLICNKVFPQYVGKKEGNLLVLLRLLEEPKNNTHEELVKKLWHLPGK